MLVDGFGPTAGVYAGIQKVHLGLCCVTRGTLSVAACSAADFRPTEKASQHYICDI